MSSSSSVCSSPSRRATRLTSITTVPTTPLDHHDPGHHKLEANGQLRRITVSVQGYTYDLALSSRALEALRGYLRLSHVQPAFELQSASSTELEAGFLVITSVLHGLVDIFHDLSKSEHDLLRHLLIEIIDNFELNLVGTTDLHSGTDINFSSAARKVVLRTYYAALSLCHRQPRRPAAESPLWSGTEESRAVALFTGQGKDNPEVLGQLREVWHIYRPLLADLLEVADPILSELSTRSEVEHAFSEHPFQLLQWINNDEDEIWDRKDMLSTSPYSMPLIGLVSLANYVIACKVLAKDPGKMRNSFKAVLGHSQGLLVATVISIADSWEEFYSLVRDACESLFWIGFEAHCATPASHLRISQIDESKENGEGEPSHMLIVRGLERPPLEGVLTRINAQLKDDEHASIALRNERDNFVIAGPPVILRVIALRLRWMSRPDGDDQSRTPFNKRKPAISICFIPVSVPFHHPALAEACFRVQQRIQHLQFCKSVISVPVLGGVERIEASRDASDAMRDVVESIMSRHVDFAKIVQSQALDQFIDFGPSGLTSLVARLVEGKGVSIINANFAVPAEILRLKGRESANWLTEFGPRVIRDSNGNNVLETKFSRAFGKPPVLAAGMTPTSVSTDFVSAVINAGFYAELASGGYHSEEELQKGIEQVVEKTPVGQGVCVNVIYASPHAIRWQIPLIKRLVHAGVPIDGLAIGAGVPTTEVIRGFINDLGLKYICFKPGSIQSILDSVQIAEDYPSFSFMIQWTGGRGGGHHSSEDIYEPILKTYAKLRSCKNIVLVVGSGFGNAEDSFPFLSGEWSIPFGYAPMPFDAILLGSRLMVCEEAKTSKACKQLIVDTPGVDDASWTETYDKTAGGVITVVSEMGQPIHKIVSDNLETRSTITNNTFKANRGTRLWAQLDKEFFSLKQPELLVRIQARKKWLVQQLNDNFQKPWFARTQGLDSADLEDMTYQAVIERMIELMYVESEHRWSHPSYPSYVIDFLHRTAARAGHSCDPVDNSPATILESLADIAHFAKGQLLHPQDSIYFVQLCRTKGRKPVNFIPVLDENFQTWFKKDSLWYSEDIASVPDQDAGRVCILQGPVAVKYSSKVDEPVGDVLGGIYSGLLQRTEQILGTAVTSVDDVIPLSWKHDHPLANCEVFRNENEITINVSFQTAPQDGQWIAWLEKSPLPIPFKAFFLGDAVHTGRTKTPNTYSKAFQPRSGGCYTFSYHISENRWTCLLYQGSKRVLELTSSDSSGLDATVSLDSLGQKGASKFDIRFTITKGTEPCLVQCSASHVDAVQRLYERMWSRNQHNSGPDFFEASTIDEIHSAAFLSAIGYDAREVKAGSSLPLDYAITLVWPALMAPLLSLDLKANLLRLVHLSNTFRLLKPDGKLFVGDCVQPVLQDRSTYLQGSNKVIEVTAVLMKSNDPLIEVKASFLCRGEYRDHENSTRTMTQKPISLVVKNSQIEALLQDKKWLQFEADDKPLRGKTIVFHPTTRVTYQKETTFATLHCHGPIYEQHDDTSLSVIGSIEYEATNVKDNKVVSFLLRHGVETDTPADLEVPGLLASRRIKLPISNERYSIASGDYNPIHTSTSFAHLAGLESTITHGMNISARVRNVVAHVVGGKDNFTSWHTEFTSMSFSGDVLGVRIYHKAMHKGQMVLDVSVRNESTNEIVMKASAEIQPPRTAYVFTGQGSQEKGMGMALYEQSAAARKLWDEADKYAMDTYGWSLLSIVRRNPTSLTLHFRGQSGKLLRQRYLAMKIEREQPDGTWEPVPSLPDLLPNATSYTFSHPQGLLFSTPFAQPAIVMTELACLAALEERQLIPNTRPLPFAGHSLGEYGALAGVAQLVKTNTLLDLTFYRGLTMANSLTKDGKGMTNYGMMAVNPSRVRKGFTQAELSDVVSKIATLSDALLEIVNFNVGGQQYVCAGTLSNLSVLSSTLEHISTTAEFESHTEIESFIQDILESSRPALARKPFAAPLPGIDVPFHSSALLSGVKPYREYLSKLLTTEGATVERLVGAWIPNVIGQTFQLTSSFAEEVRTKTGSKFLQDVIESLKYKERALG